MFFSAFSFTHTTNFPLIAFYLLQIFPFLCPFTIFLYTFSLSNHFYLEICSLYFCSHYHSFLFSFYFNKLSFFHSIVFSLHDLFLSFLFTLSLSIYLFSLFPFYHNKNSCCYHVFIYALLTYYEDPHNMSIILESGGIKRRCLKNVLNVSDACVCI